MIAEYLSNALFPRTSVYICESTRSQVIPTGISMISDVFAKLFFFFGPGIFLEYVEKCYTLAVDFIQIMQCATGR